MFRVVGVLDAIGGGSVYEKHQGEQVHRTCDGREEPIRTATLMTDEGLLVESLEEPVAYVVPHLGLCVREFGGEKYGGLNLTAMDSPLHPTVRDQLEGCDKPHDASRFAPPIQRSDGKYNSRTCLASKKGAPVVESARRLL